MSCFFSASIYEAWRWAHLCWSPWSKVMRARKILWGQFDGYVYKCFIVSIHVLAHLKLVKIYFSRQLKGCKRSGLDIILLRGCLMLLLQPKKADWVLTLQKFIEDQLCFSTNSLPKLQLCQFSMQWLVSLFNKLLFICFRRNKELVETLSKPSSNSKELSFPTKYSQSSFEQFITCLWKQNLSYWRNPQYTVVRFFYTVIISLMFGTICWKFGAKRFFLLWFYFPKVFWFH